MKILLVDDEQEWMQSLSRTLVKYGVTAREDILLASGSTGMFETLQNESIGLILLDLYLGSESGEDLLAQVLADFPEQAVVIMTGLGSIENAVNCIKKGAMDYFIKSTPVNELINNIKRILKIIELRQENAGFRHQIAAQYNIFNGFITANPQMYAAFDYISTVAKGSQHILITGESGAGKGVLAKIAGDIARPGKPFISVNLAGYDDQVFADTMFGHVKGAFTGADSLRPGMIQQAGDGVIFMDEIGDLSPQSQLKLLYLLQDGTYQPLGSDKALTTSAKFIFATNQDLAEKLKNKTLRTDLFYRLNTHRIHIPPLRERREDIPLLIKYFAAAAAADFAKTVPVFTEAFIRQIKTHPLPGNARQLKAIIHDLTARCGNVVDIEHLAHIDTEDGRIDQTDEAEEDLPTIEEMTITLIKKALQKTGGNQQRAAKLLGISQPTLSRRIKDL